MTEPTMTTRDALVKAWALVERPGAYPAARPQLGRPGRLVRRSVTEAVREIAGGANEASGDALARLNKSADCPIELYAETHTHAEVLAVFDRAIEAAP